MEHKTGNADGFTKKYGVTKLMYYEVTTSIESAIAREKQLKHWNREWKINLTIKDNPDWNDLYDTFTA